MLLTQKNLSSFNKSRLKAKFLERLPPNKLKPGTENIRRGCSRAKWDFNKVSLLLHITMFMVHLTDLNRMEREHLRSERMKQRVPDFGCPKLDGIKWNDLQESLQQNHGSGVNVYAIDGGPSSIPDFCTSFRDYSGEVDPYLASQTHADAVLSILKGTKFSLAKDVKLHYFRLFHINGFGMALEAIADQVILPAVVTISCYPLYVNSDQKQFEAIFKAIHKLTKEMQVPVLVAAGNEGRKTKLPNTYFDQLDFEGLWFIGNAKRIENSRRGSYWDMHRKSQWGPWVKYYALGTKVRVQGMYSITTSDGTSFSAPVTAAYIARILSLFPDARIDQIETILDALALNVLFMERSSRAFLAKVIPLVQPDDNE